MSRTTMNWTALRSASASHFRRSEATMALCPFIVVAVASDSTEATFKSQVKTSQQQACALHSGCEQALRPVLPDCPHSRADRGSLGVVDRARAAAGVEALHGSGGAATGDRHEHPRGAAQGPRDRRRSDEAPAAAARSVARLRADAVRPGPEAGHPRACALGHSV